ncbi:cell division protein ZapA [Carnobacterium divergens]|uniref:cell division protein ZapA n=1 Tax=Carnobacterium divergens TaxID=2748 RepID=UPI0010715FFD|nr:cell division protein ZapA [Carnobacterium divergens]TFI85941.1 cell division protein ZapA [Carnobacterium divergens]TFI95742.1 cell division protein ZapA [Carnobacterium divergens]TFJ12860.1 cell division protein ZapA [Carnobacterium divergens]
MSGGKKRYKATIAGKSYTIVGSRPTEYLQLVAETVDEQINQIKSLTDNLELDKMAVLTAVNAVSDQLEMQIEMEKMRQKITELETKLAKFEEG